MGKYTQANRPMRVTTPLGPDDLLLEGFSGVESLSSLFRFRLELLAEPSTEIAFDKLLGQPVAVALEMPDGKSRYFSGIVARMSRAEQVHSGRGTWEFNRYRAEMVPKAWLLTKTSRSRIFQHLSAVDILKKVLVGVNATFDQVQGTFEPRDYCVQYRESDFAFACRLMEEEGIYFFFKHAESGSQMILANTPQGHPDVPGTKKVPYKQFHGGLREQQQVDSWERIQEIRSGKYTLWDHSFELPDKNLEATRAVQESVKVGTLTQKLKAGGNDQFEIYDFPGGYAGRFDGIDKNGGDQSSALQKVFDDNSRTVGIRMEQETASGLTLAGSGSCQHFTAGHKFTLDKHFDADGDYVLTQVEHASDISDAYASGNATPLNYQNSFRCIPAALPYRPARDTPRPRVEGAQTAVVVGPQGQEIAADKYGRVKVQFFWDREGQKDTGSSCWVRVASPWAGKQWGAVHIPRVGQEVVVAFLDGDPDQPIIVGSVYNAENMPPYTLPDNVTQSGLKSRSSAQGTADNYNELRFEDKKGSEEILFHAERDFNRVVENNDTLTVGSSDSQTCPDGSQTIVIYKDRTETVKTGNEAVTIEQGNRTVAVKQGDDTHTVTKGNRVVEVDTGDDTHTIKTGNRTVTINTGNDSLSIKAGNRTTKIDAGSSSTEAMQSIELKVGANSITIDQTGITLKGIKISIEGEAMVEIKAAMVQVNASGVLTLKGGMTLIN